MKAKIINIKEEAEGIKTFFLKTEKEYDFIAGQFTNFSFETKTGKNSHIFTISSSPEKESISFTTMKSESDYKQKLFSMKEGDEIEVGNPTGEFILEKAENKKIVFVSGGIGITPFKSMLEDLEAKGENKDIILLYSNKTLKRIVFESDLNRIEKVVTGLKIVHFLSQEETTHSFEKGRITKAGIEKYVQNISERIFFVVGPPGFVDAMKMIMEELNANAIYENFNGY